MSGSSSSPSKGYQFVPEDENGPQNRRTPDHGGSPTLPSVNRTSSRGTYNRILNMDTIEKDHHDASADGEDETNSLVLSEASPPARRNDPRNSIFRDAVTPTTSSSSYPVESGVEMNTNISRTSSAVSATSKSPSVLLSSPYTDDLAVSHHTAPSGLLSRQGSRGASSAASADDDWDDDDNDDELNIRRYHLDYTIGRGFQSPGGRSSPRGNGTSTDPSFPAEPGNRLGDRLRYKIQQILFHWQSLRQAARQRRAARLLMMPSESWRHKFRAGVISWCCDATDMGIALTASGVAVWIFIGLVSRNTVTVRYWILGLTLFVIRISARRCYELCWSCVASNLASRRQNRSRLGSRQRLGSVDDDQHSMIVITNHHHVISNANDDDNHLASPV
jgi:hypothetical protein